MKKLILVLTVISICMVSTVPVHSAVKKLAQTGIQLLKVDMSARAAAMGGAYTMVGEGADALFYNPAGMTRSQSRYTVFANHTSWIADISYNAAALAVDLGNIGTVGATFITADYGEILGTKVSAVAPYYEDTGSLDVGTYTFGIGYARDFTNKFTIGGHVKYVSQHLGSSHLDTGEDVENEVTGIAYDVGTIFHPGYKSLRIGMSIRNFSEQYRYQEEPFELPLTFTIGAAMDMLDLRGDDHENAFILSVDAVHPRDYTERIHVGGEFLFMDILALRAGYKYNYDEEDLTLGAGIQSNLSDFNIKIDYAYSVMQVFDAVNRFSISLGF